MSVATELCDQIIATLNNTNCGMEFTAVRRSVPMTEADFRTMGDLQVYVMANTRKAERRVQRGENAFRRTYKPVVIVQKKLTPGTDYSSQLAESDALQAVVERIEKALECVPLSDLNFLGFNEATDSDIYGIDALRNAGVFVVPITLEYTD